MRYLQLFLLSLLLSLVNACLVIQFPITTTPEPHCGCQFTILNKTNLHANLPRWVHPFYDEPWFSPLGEPIASGDECFRSLSCPKDYTLVITQDQSYNTYPDVELTAMCDPRTQQWLVDDGFHEVETLNYIEVACVRFGVCPCFGGSIDIPAFWEKLMEDPLYQNDLIDHPIQVGTIGYSEDGCARNITCPDGWRTIKIGYEEDLLNSCQADWINTWYNLQYKYYLCVDYRTLLR